MGSRSKQGSRARTNTVNLILLVALVLSIVFATCLGAVRLPVSRGAARLPASVKSRRGGRDHLCLASSPGAGCGSGGSGAVGHRRFVSRPVSQSPGRSVCAGNFGRRGSGRRDWNLSDSHAFFRRIQRHRGIGLCRFGAHHDPGVVSGSHQRRLRHGNLAAGRLRHRHHAECGHRRLRVARGSFQLRPAGAGGLAAWTARHSGLESAWPDRAAHHRRHRFSRCRWRDG